VGKEIMKMLLTILFFAFITCYLSGIAHAEISVIALVGQSAPGVEGATFSSLSQASVNNSGEIAFQAELSNGGTGIFRLSHGQLSVVVLSGQAISGSPGLSFGAIGWPQINDSGTIAFIASIQAGMQNLKGVFVATGTSVRKVLDTTATLPGSGDPMTGGLSGPLQLNNKGDIAVLGFSSTSGFLLVISNGAVSSVIPMETSPREFAMNNRGDIVIGNGSELSLYSAGTTQLIAKAIHLGGGFLTAPAVNDQGDVSFTIGYGQTLHGTLLPNRLFRWHAGILEKIVSDGDAVPGVTNASLFYTYGPSVDNSGRVFFGAQFYVNNKLSHGLFMYNNGNISLLAQDGQVLQGVGSLTAIGYSAANDSGVVTFNNGTAGIFQLNAFYQIFFPQVADGAFENQWSWRTTLMLSNPDKTSPASLSVAFIQDDGTPMNVGIQASTDNQFSFTIPPSGSLRLETNGLGNVKTGWARVQADKKLSGISIYSFYDGAGNYVSEVGSPASSSLNAFSLFVESTADTNTGIAVANPNSSQADATLTLIDSKGVPLGFPISMTVPANGHIQKYLTELFQGIVPSDFHGMLEVVSPLPIVGINLKQRQHVFTWLPLTF
jgi:hypothetical protein